ncbi:MAG: hypothetical protein SCK29_01260 [Bacillota bacterium]|nr:hypothetical protein [Bacillota bacterium]MDW7682729.1 hypothetical protein [Bacillota bacterium]
MAVITIDLGPQIEMSDLKRVRQQLERLGPDDEIRIVMEAADAHEAAEVAAELERQGFDWQPHGSHDGRDYYLTAKRKLLH